MRKNTQSTVYKDESRMFYAAVISFVVVFFSYIYFVSASVADVVMRKEVDAQVNELATSISQLESEYIEMQHLLSNDIASLKGYVAVETKVFMDKSEQGTLVLRGN